MTFSYMSIKPQLKYFDLTMITVSLVIGVGIFRTPAIVAQHAGSPAVFFAAWIFGGVVSLCGALTFAEIGSRLPVAGGYYKIFSATYHPVYAFMLNWAQVVINSASAAGVAIIGAEYIRPVIFDGATENYWQVKGVAMIIILVLFILNYSGIKMGARTQNLLSVLKILLILIFCLAIFFPAHVSNAPNVGFDNFSWSGLLSAFGVSLISVFFTFGGYQNTVNFGADIADAKRQIPRAIFTGISIVLVLYLLLNVTYYHVLGFVGLQQSNLVASDLASALFGSVGGKITSVVLFVSVLGFLNTSLLSNPRVYYAMAEEKTLPSIFMKVNSKKQVQEFALAFFVALMMISLFVADKIESIINFVILTDSLALASAGAAIFILRKKSKEIPHDGYQIKWYPLVPLVFMLALLFVTFNVIVSDPQNALKGSAVFFGGFPLYFLLKKLIDKGN